MWRRRLLTLQANPTDMAMVFDGRRRPAAAAALLCMALLLLASGPTRVAASCDRSSLDNVDPGFTKYLAYEADVRCAR